MPTLRGGVSAGDFVLWLLEGGALAIRFSLTKFQGSKTFLGYFPGSPEVNS